MPAQHNFMRNTNALSILQHIRSHGETTRREIQAATGLSWAAVSTITAELIGQNILVERALEERVPGRNPNILDFNPSQNLTIGVDVNVEGITVVLLDLRGRILDSQKERLIEAEKNSVLMQMTRMTEETLRRNRLENNHLLGIGISMQGVVDRDGAVSVYNQYIRDWTDVNLQEQLQDYFGVFVRVIHDPVCIALSQLSENPALENTDYVLIRLDYGIGMCHVHNGKTLVGHQGKAGELGRFTVGDMEGRLSDYCSLRGIAKQVYEICISDNTIIYSPFRDNDIECVNRYVTHGITMAENGDERYLEIFKNVGRYLGFTFGNLINILNPKYIILTGAFLDYNTSILESIKEHIRVVSSPFMDYEVLIAPESRLSAAKGAAMHFINAAFEDMDSILLKRK